MARGAIDRDRPRIRDLRALTNTPSSRLRRMCPLVVVRGGQHRWRSREPRFVLTADNAEDAQVFPAAAVFAQKSATWECSAVHADA